MQQFKRLFQDSNRVTTFIGIVAVSVGIGLALNLAHSGALIGLGLALINLGRTVQVDKE